MWRYCIFIFLVLAQPTVSAAIKARAENLVTVLKDIFNSLNVSLKQKEGPDNHNITTMSSKHNQVATTQQGHYITKFRSADNFKTAKASEFQPAYPF